MESPWLYDTAVPVLLGTAADSRAAGRLARRLFRRHRVVCFWFGRRLSLNLFLYARHRAVSLGALNDWLRVRALRDFAADPEQDGRLLALIPCSARAEAFLARCGGELSTDYVLLSGQADDPLEALLQAEQPAEAAVGAAQTGAVHP